MKLEKIKLSGFKSFVDQTIIPIGRTITAVVGPNGCGKSNIIDAVRWVMGESSAKHLRGGTMSDVIFNGCATRKPVSLATVELIFDNSEGTLGGEYAQYAKIAIKRQVSRDGQSTYLLNGSRCRRKDITDLFLGTGLGSRSYAIIEQGTISRMVEAKPDELRVHIEEAAGISKYKERRAETETRISHTRQNLQRLQDLRSEVAVQVKQLHKQAEKAESYVALKKQQRQLQAELLALRWQAQHAVAQTLESQWQTVIADYDRLLVQQTATEQQANAQRETQKSLQYQVDESQVAFYKVSAAVSQLEQNLRHQQQTVQQLDSEIHRLQQQLATDTAAYQHELTCQQKTHTEQCQAEQRWQDAQQQQQQAVSAQQQGQQQHSAWQQQWNQFQSEKATQHAQWQVQQTKIAQWQQHNQPLQARLSKAEQEARALSQSDLTDEIAKLAKNSDHLQQQRDTVIQQLRTAQQQLQENSLAIKQLQVKLHDLRSQQQSLTGKITSLELLQQHALGKDKKALQAWFKQHDLDHKPLLAEFLQVETGWERAVEIVLGDYLAAPCVDVLDAVAKQLATLPEESLVIFETEPATGKSVALSLPSLADKISSAWNLTPLLHGIYCVESLPQALQLRPQLKTEESVMTQDGVWLGTNWLKMSQPDDRHAGLLQRETQLRALKQQRQALIDQLQVIESHGEVLENQAKLAQHAVEHGQKSEKMLTADIARTHASQQVLQHKIAQQAARQTQLLDDINELNQQLVENNAQIGQAESVKQQAATQIAVLADQQTTLETTYTALQQQQQLLDQAADQAKQQVHTAHADLERLRTAERQTVKELERLHQQQTARAARLATLQQQQQTTVVQLAEQQQALAKSQENQRSIEITLQQQRDKKAAVDTALTLTTTQFAHLQQQVVASKQGLDDIRFAVQENQVRLQTLQEQSAVDDHDLAVILKNLPPHATEVDWKKQSEPLAVALAQLGNVNLTAISEHKTQAARLDFLTAQQQDLTEALQTLEQAIAKIDKETRLRFKETFDKINTGLQEKFPKLFGGGQAYLELTQQNFLDSGVTLIARPPGKKNSSIHLLSGGEKALTAIALVFAIFELNPAPFCLLDEVDAPLDDANVGRFSKMVEEMAATVQFLFISHNKVTMEIAQQLTGVTMKEAGVSRMVAVTIEQAVQLAEG